MITKEKLIDYSIIALIAFIYLYSSVLAIYIVVASTPYVLPYEVENFLSYLYFWIPDHTTTAVSLGIIGYIVIYLTVLYIVKKLIDLIVKLIFKIKLKIQNIVDDIVNED